MVTFMPSGLRYIKERVCVLASLPPENVSVDAAWMDDGRELVVRTIITQWSARQPDEISVPRDWWQAVRERWLPRWWLRRYPVRYRRFAIWVHHPRFSPGVTGLPSDPIVSWREVGE